MNQNKATTVTSLFTRLFDYLFTHAIIRSNIRPNIRPIIGLNIRFNIRLIYLFILCLAVPIVLSAQAQEPYQSTPVPSQAEPMPGLEKQIKQLMEDGHIPGLSLVVLQPGKAPYIKGFGYADPARNTAVTPDTRFELASCSKSFTALAALLLEDQGLIHLDDNVSRYIPGFYMTFEGKKCPITLRQLLHHTSGIPWKSIRFIEQGSDPGALAQTAENLSGTELDHLPGTSYEYASINYDIIGRIIEIQSGLSYEQFMAKNIFKPLGLNATSAAGYHDLSRPSRPQPAMAAGHKIAFFAARPYDAPPYRGNAPSGYIISNGRDVARWLAIQLGLLQNPLASLIEKSRQRDNTEIIDSANMSYYAMGWNVSLKRSGEVRHIGLNPSFTAYILFLPRQQIAVAVMANSNSNYTKYIARTVMNQLQGIPFKEIAVPASDMDKTTSMISIITAFCILVMAVYLLTLFISFFRGKRYYSHLTFKQALKFLAALLVTQPFLFGIYLVPYALSGVSWDAALVWAPQSFQAAALLILVALGLAYICYVISQLVPHKNKYLNSIPRILSLSLLAGAANAVVIFLVSGSLVARTQLAYMLYYFALASLLYVLGARLVQLKLTVVTFDIVYDIRMKLIDKVFYTSFQKFEKLQTGRIFATLNDDTGRVGTAAAVIMKVLTSIITVFGAFLYLVTIATWATLLTIALIAAIAALYHRVSQTAKRYLDEARDTRNVYMGLLSGLVEGFKELSIHFNKKRQYREEIRQSTHEFRSKMVAAMQRFIDATAIGSFMMVAILGAAAFAVPRLFPRISTFTLMSYIMVLLYINGPIRAILGAIPDIMNLKIAWSRVQGFIRDIPANIDPADLEKLDTHITQAHHIQARNVMFQYQSKDGDEPFAVGPINFEARSGEIIFIVGGNGSGKTTLAKLLTGLYIPDSGAITVDGKTVDNFQLGEYFSTVFSDFHLFEKVYDIDLENKKEEAEKYLDILHLKHKVTLDAEAFSTVDLSGGQRKRLALLQCYLEDSPIYLFDELAADQDPQFRRFFYRELLLRMKEQGKIVIAITHDDHYFDVADKLVKMNMGKIQTLEPITENIPALLQSHSATAVIS